MKIDKKKLRTILIVVVLVIVVIGYLRNAGNDEDQYYDTTGYGTTGYTANDTGSSGLQTPAATSAPLDLSTIEKSDGTATVLIYMIGSNLESQGGCATADIKEMLASGIGNADNVNIIIESGGAKKWKNSWMSADKLQRFKVEGDSLKLIEEQKKTSMVNPSTLSDFIRWGVTNYPAERLGFIFWDHGGGTLAGFGSDELFSGSLNLADINTAFTNVGVHFDFVGFDACLMGTVENAYMLSRHADYLIASEETEPGPGWYYTGWLQILAKNPTIDMSTLGTRLVDDFVTKAGGSRQSTTLSVIDLSKIPDLYKTLCGYMASARTVISSDGYKSLSTARSNTRSYGDGSYDQIDIVDFAQQAGIKGSDDVIRAVGDSIVYTNTNMNRTHGLAMYFPYDYPKYYQTMLTMCNSFGMENTDYDSFFKEFLNVMTHNQTSGSPSPMSQLTGGSFTSFFDYSGESWYSSSYSESGATSMAQYAGTELQTVQKGDEFVLRLSDAQWEEITYMDLWLYIDDGSGYIDMGHDNVCEFDADGDLRLGFDYTWVAINGVTVPFFAQKEGETSDGTWYTYGYVPAFVKVKESGETIDADIVLYWDDNHDGGYVLGYRPSADGELAQSERNVAEFAKGDVIQFICDYYTYDGDFENSYLYGDPITVNGALKVSYENLGEVNTEVSIHLKDIYNNEYWTETICYTW